MPVPDPITAEVPAGFARAERRSVEEAKTTVQRVSGPLAFSPCRIETSAAAVVQTIGEYETRKKLGEGGMGVVYQGWDVQLRRNVAIKVLLPHYSNDPEARERFLREARSAASVVHDNVVSIYHVGDHHGIAYLVMPLLRGRTLEQFLQKKGNPTIPQALRIAREVVAGLAEAHRQGLIHRDVKPANIWLEAPNGRVKLLDFGIAKPTATSEHSACTDAGVVMGTPAFMSPEQARGHAVDFRSDLFSLGAVLYRMCTGEPPFVRSTAMDTLTALVSEDVPNIREANPEVSESLARLIHRLLARNPDDRPASDEDVIRELRQIEREYLGERGTGVVSQRAMIRETIEATPLPVVIPTTETCGFEVVDTDPSHTVVKPNTQTNRTRKKRRKPAKSSSTPLIVGIVMCAIGLSGILFAVIQTQPRNDRYREQPGMGPQDGPPPEFLADEGDHPEWRPPPHNPFMPHHPPRHPHPHGRGLPPPPRRDP